MKISKSESKLTITDLLSTPLSCVERGISPEQVKGAILSGEIVEDYPNDKYGPSCLIYGATREGKILHVQCSMAPVWIVTAYDPTLNPEEWDRDYKRRRKTS